MFYLVGFKRIYSNFTYLCVTFIHSEEISSKNQRYLADWNYLVGQIVVGQRPLVAVLEYYALRLFGGLAWRRHQEEYAKDPDYGREYFPQQEISSG